MILQHEDDVLFKIENDFLEFNCKEEIALLMHSEALHKFQMALIILFDHTIGAELKLWVKKTNDTISFDASISKGKPLEIKYRFSFGNYDLNNFITNFNILLAEADQKVYVFKGAIDNYSYLT